MKVQSARDEFFACARLPDDEDRSVMPRNALDHQHEPLHRFAAKDSLSAGQIENDGFVTHLWLRLSDALGGKCRSAE
jgi:hypothetical protein